MSLPNIMYPAGLSTVVQLSQELLNTSTIIDVTDASAFPPAPNLATISTDNGYEVILYLELDIANNRITNCQRGISGTIAKQWAQGTFIYHSWTGFNANNIINNINYLDNKLQDSINRIYNGMDLTVRFSNEINSTPYNGDVWAWIQARIQAANFVGIYVGDYIPFIVDSNNMNAEIAGIDTYYNYGNPAVGHHIDFISRDLWPTEHVFNKANYNNGTSVSPSPWLASDLYAYLNSLSMNVPNSATANPALVAVDYTTTGVYDKLPNSMKAVIKEKHVRMPLRYTSGSLLTNDNSETWGDIGKLWIPSEVEVYGMIQWGSRVPQASMGFVQYPIFANNMKRIKGQNNGGSSASWWLSSSSGDGSAHITRVGNDGAAIHSVAPSSGMRVPVCFRIL